MYKTSQTQSKHPLEKWHASESPAGLVSALTTATFSSSPRVSDSVSLGLSPRISILTSLQVIQMLVHGLHLEKPRWRQAALSGHSSVRVTFASLTPEWCRHTVMLDQVLVSN